MSAARSRFAIYMGTPPIVTNKKLNFGWQLIHDSALPEESHVADAKLTREISAAAALSFTLYPGGYAWPKADEGTYELSIETAKTYLMVVWLNPYAKWQTANDTWNTDIAWCDTVSDASETTGEIVFVGRVDDVEVSMADDGLLSANVTAVETADEMDERAAQYNDTPISIAYMNVGNEAWSGDSSVKIAYSTGEDYGLQLRTGAQTLNGIAKCFNIGTTDTSIKSYEIESEDGYPNYHTLKERLDDFVERYGLGWEQTYPDYDTQPTTYCPSELARIQIRTSAYVNSSFQTLAVCLGQNMESYTVTTNNDGIKTVRVPYFGTFNVEVNGEQESYAPSMYDVWTMYTGDAVKYKCHQGFLQAYSAMKSEYDVVLAWPSSYVCAALVSPSAVAAYGASLEFYNAGNVLGLSESSYTLVEWPTAINDALKNKTVSAWSTFWQEAIKAYATQLEPITTVDVSGYDTTMTYGGYGNPPHLFQQCTVIDTITGKTYAQRIEGYTVHFDKPWKYDLTLGSIPQRISK